MQHEGKKKKNEMKWLNPKHKEFKEKKTPCSCSCSCSQLI